jgi:hypothetical protein
VYSIPRVYCRLEWRCQCLPFSSFSSSSVREQEDSSEQRAMTGKNRK